MMTSPVGSDKHLLLKYQTAKVVKDETIMANAPTSGATTTVQRTSITDTGIGKSRFLPPINPVSTSNNNDEIADIQEILNCILPPRQWHADDKLWMQMVSTTPATRLDVIHIQDQFDHLLEERQAKEFGICPIRRALYNQLFVTVNCAERGLLLMRVRDEIRMSLATYQSLYESAIAFGLRKALGAEQRKSDAEMSLDRMQKENEDLQEQIESLESRLDEQNRLFEEEKDLITNRMTEENARLKLATQQLKTQIEALIQPLPAEYKFD